jgi:hypothetical protein
VRLISRRNAVVFENKKDRIAPALPSCAEHVRQLEGESPFHNLMEVK